MLSGFNLESHTVLKIKSLLSFDMEEEAAFFYLVTVLKDVAGCTLCKCLVALLHVYTLLDGEQV